MSCYQMRMLLPCFENDELSDEDRETVHLHLAACSRCRLALESIRAMHGQLSLLHTISVDSEITDSVISRIRRMTDSRAEETTTDPSDIPSAVPGEKSADASLEEKASRSPFDSDDDLLPGWAASGEP